MVALACHCLNLIFVYAAVVAEKRCFIPMVCDEKPVWVDVPRQNTEVVLKKQYEAELRNLEGRFRNISEEIKELKKYWEEHMAKLGESSTICPSQFAQDSANSNCLTTKQPTTSLPASTTGCLQSSFIFPNGDQRTDYVRYKGTLPHLTEFSICAWLSPTLPHTVVKGTILSYCVKGSKWCNTLMVSFTEANKLSMHVNDHEEIVSSAVTDPIKSRSLFCLTASSDKKNVVLYINGESVGVTTHGNRWKVNISSGGLLIIGHEQDPPRNNSDAMPYFVQATNAFVGKIENLNLWDRILDQTEIQYMNHTNCFCPADAVVSLNKTTAEVKGNVTASYNGSCD